jgi:hypothetical protein
MTAVPPCRLRRGGTLHGARRMHMTDRAVEIYGKDT